MASSNKPKRNHLPLVAFVARRRRATSPLNRPVFTGRLRILTGLHEDHYLIVKITFYLHNYIFYHTKPYENNNNIAIFFVYYLSEYKSNKKFLFFIAKQALFILVEDVVYYYLISHLFVYNKE